MEKFLKRLSFSWQMYKIRYRLKDRIMTLNMFLKEGQELTHYGNALIYLATEHDQNKT